MIAKTIGISLPAVSVEMFFGLPTINIHNYDNQRLRDLGLSAAGKHA